MKNVFVISLAVAFVSLSCKQRDFNSETKSNASVKNTIYKSNEGCEVELEQRAKGVFLFFMKDGKNRGNVGYLNDFSSANFVYCSDEKTRINHYTGSKGTGLMISCNEHQNGEAVTRGRLDISIINGEPEEIKIDGQRKGLFGWKQEILLQCTNLVKK